MKINSNLENQLNLIRDNEIKSANYKAAIKKLNELIEINGPANIINYYLGICYANLKDYNNAIKYFTSFNYSDSLSDIQIFQVNMILGIIYTDTELQDFTLAEKYLKLALSNNDKNSMIYSALGYLYYLMKKYELAIMYFRKAIDITPDNATARNNLSYLYYELNININEAIEEAKKAVSLNPKSSAYRDTLAMLLYKAGKYEEAEKEIKKAIELNNFSTLKNNDENKKILQKHLNEIIKKKESLIRK